MARGSRQRERERGEAGVERQASQMQHIAKPGSGVEHCCSAEQGSEKELKSFFF